MRQQERETAGVGGTRKHGRVHSRALEILHSYLLHNAQQRFPHRALDHSRRRFLLKLAGVRLDHYI